MTSMVSYQDHDNVDQKKFLRTKIQIGNCKGPINYPSTQNVFHHDDVPEPARIRKEEVLNYKKSRILEQLTVPDQWSKSTKINKPVVERRQMENHVKDRSHQYQYNYRAETLDSLKNVEPIDKSTKFHISSQLPSTTTKILEIQSRDPVQRGRLHRTQEMPVHPNLANNDVLPAWNSTIVLTEKERQRSLDKMTKHANEWSKAVKEVLPMKKDYLNPYQAAKKEEENIRQMKADGTFSVHFNKFRPPPEPVDRNTFRNQLLNSKLHKVKTTVHSGVWGVNPVDGR